MSFPKEFPSEALGQLIHVQDGNLPATILAGYEALGFILYEVLGDVQYPKQGLFDTIRAGRAGQELAEKVKARATVLQAGGLGTALIILQLLAEFGPQILALIQMVRDLLNKGK